MHEVAFLKQNAEKWKQFEALLQAPGTADPDRLAALFIQVTDDLSYAKTFYPGSQTTRYLNGLAAEVHQAIYRNKKEERGRLRRFWAVELPLEVRRSHRELFTALVIFLVAFGIGALSAANDGGFVRLIMGDAYVNMTLQNIDRGDPLAVYKQASEVDMFLGITLNNVRVSFLAFSLGLLCSLGTGFVLFQNGVMVGAFHYFFYNEALLSKFLLVVYIHGTLELSAIVIAGGAGLVMGNSILFPGTYTRVQSLVRGARRGLKVVVGLVPIFITAGFLEGFVTRRTEMPVAVSLAIILGSLGFLIWYFVVYPYQVDRAQAPVPGPEATAEAVRPSPTHTIHAAP
jgi:uncharacterized membrane protein SpoIIM required for sporulation